MIGDVERQNRRRRRVGRIAVRSQYLDTRRNRLGGTGSNGSRLADSFPAYLLSVIHLYSS